MLLPRLILLTLILIQVTIMQAQEDYQNFDTISDSIVTDSAQVVMLSLSQFKSMNTKEMCYFLKQNDNVSFRMYNIGTKLQKKGLIMLAPGVLGTTAGVLLITRCDHYRDKSFGSLGYARVITWEYLGGIFFTAIGGAVTFVSSGLIVSGSILNFESKRKFINNHIKNKNYIQPNLNIGYTNNGIGLTINF